MAVTPSDILEPVGIVDPEWFPHATTDADPEIAAEAHTAAVYLRIEEYIADGETRGAAITDADDLDAYVRAWATHRAARAVYLQRAYRPSSESHEAAGSASWTTAQINAFKDLADEYAGIADALLPVPTVAAVTPLRSVSISNEFSW